MDTPSNHYDVGKFHEKFGLENTAFRDMKPKLISLELAEFRLKFLKEELREIEEGYERDDLTKIADGLVDLVYVALGTAHLHGLPWQELWNAVQRANMRKERCEINHAFVANTGPDDVGCCFPMGVDICRQPRHKHSLRGNINDVIKPPGWTPPDIIGVLTLAGWPGPPLPLDKD